MVYAMTMNMSPVATWSVTDLFMLFVMWAIMMAGMMLPSAYPVVMLVEKINQNQSQLTSYASSIFFAFGYLIAWAIYSVLITLVQYLLHHLELLSPMMDSANQQFTVAILMVAGIYQFTPLKQQCLKLCRSPMTILTQKLKPGKLQAIGLGIGHGSYCVGCCWALMAILFVSGVMNIKWILILTIVVMVEKMVPRGDLVAKALGLGLIIYSLIVISSS